jgi:site-specific DNA-methyltransferase (adenine-specific)
MLLLHGDCLEVMKTLPDRSVDLFLCDLPYGCLGPQKKGGGIPREGTEGAFGGCLWDIPIDLAQFWIEVKRLCRDDHAPVLMFCNTRFGYDLIKSNEAWFRYDLVWEKTNAVGFLLANRMPMRSHELIYVFAKKGARYYRKDIEEGRRCVKSVLTIAGKKGKGNHPTQKPDALYEWLIERYSKEGDTILDPTAGSFASVFTADRMGRNGIGIEKDADFYAKANASAVSV